MKIPAEPFNREKQDLALVDALTSGDGVAIYLDTSAIVWMYRIREKARDEFVSLLESSTLANKVHIPFWSMHELMKHRKSPNVLLPLIGQKAELNNLLSNITSNSYLFVDDGFAKGIGKSSASEYLADLDAAFDSVRKIIGGLGKAGAVSAVDQQLAPIFEKFSLRQPLSSLAPLRDEFLARCEGRLPPGYEDRKKSGDTSDSTSGANRFGDFVFWKSVLDHSALNDDIRRVVIISHDSKPDWVYYPNNYCGYGEKLVANNSKTGIRVTCPQPSLSSEIELNSGVSELFVVSIMQLVSAISFSGSKSLVSDLARAIQIEATEKPAVSIAPDNLGGVDQSAAVGNAYSEAQGGVVAGDVDNSAESESRPEVHTIGHVKGSLSLDVGAKLENLPSVAFADSGYVNDAAGLPAADEVISDLKSHNWYTQNPAVGKLDSVLRDPETSDLQLFMIGRNLYQAACGNAFGAVDFLDRVSGLLERYPASAIEVLVAGAWTEVYFNSQGEVRKHPKYEQLDLIFDLAEEPEFRAVGAWVHGRMSSIMNRLVAIPGVGKGIALFKLSISGSVVQAIEVGGEVVTTPYQPDDIGVDINSMRVGKSKKSLISLLSSTFCLPPERVFIEPEDVDDLTFSRIVLMDWSTETSLSFKHE